MNTDWICRLRGACLIGLFLVGLTGLKMASAFAQEAPSVRTPAPDWKLTDLNRKSLSLSDFRGKVVILDFWATWCMPCRIEIPHLVELQKDYAAKGLAIIGVSLDEQGPAVVKKFVKQIGVNYPILIGSEKIAEKYGGIVALPTTFVIDRQGRIVSRHIGYDDKASFEKEIQSLL